MIFRFLGPDYDVVLLSIQWLRGHIRVKLEPLTLSVV